MAKDIVQHELKQYLVLSFLLDLLQSNSRIPADQSRFAIYGTVTILTTLISYLRCNDAVERARIYSDIRFGQLCSFFRVL